jgi:hypothetical protein
MLEERILIFVVISELRGIHRDVVKGSFGNESKQSRKSTAHNKKHVEHEVFRASRVVPNPCCRHLVWLLIRCFYLSVQCALNRPETLVHTWHYTLKLYIT